MRNDREDEQEMIPDMRKVKEEHEEDEEEAERWMKSIGRRKV